MPFSRLDHAKITRSLGQIAEQHGDVADVFFERREEIVLPPEGAAPGVRVWREAGLAVRLMRRGQTWLVSRDGISPRIFAGALRRAARVAPAASYPDPPIAMAPWDEPPEAPEMYELPAALGRAIRTHHVTFPLRLTLRRHRRWTRVIGTRLAAAMETETFYSVDAEMPWGRYGTLLAALRDDTADILARTLVHAYRAHDAAPPSPSRGPAVLGPAAGAVLLHEGVAHALEVDTLAIGGHPEAAIGVKMASSELNVFDDPASAPVSVRRAADDEGHPVSRRCLLRRGVVEQPIADGLWARRSEILRGGGARRADRHSAPGPRSSHLELAPGEATHDELLAASEGGLFLPEVSRGGLHPLSGELVLHFPYGYRIENGAPGTPVGPSTLRAHVTDVLRAVTGVSNEAAFAGAGWCAKAGRKLPVWATSPTLRLEGARIAP